MEQNANSACPVCLATLPPQAVLCIVCGYHLQKGHMLATHIEREPASVSDENPYASPQITESYRGLPVGSELTLDLTPQAARRVKAVVDDADNIFWMIPMVCFCGPMWVLMLPWYTYRLYSWHRLYDQFAELRQPSAFSEHARITARFPDARWRLLAGVIVGMLFWAWAVVMLIRNYSLA